jgi:hypothetical protein
MDKFVDHLSIKHHFVVNNTKLIFILKEKEKRKMNTIVDLDGIT